ncbi:WecB/TagA/CpsF family glycosyltransferase [Candidatus Peregrinibacteria bacterium]|nr:WecB/TagA/CpsF family glycosyltransferase [Candidatus Peregrinibacteria bacterium]
MKKVKILDVQFDVCTKDEALRRILDFLEFRKGESGKQIVTPNPEMLLESSKNKQFHTILNRAWLSIPDGIGILWASAFKKISRHNSGLSKLIKAKLCFLSLLFYPKLCKKVFPERITGVDLMESICAVSRKSKTPIFLLGAKDGVAVEAQKFLETKYAGVNVVGTFSGSASDDDFPAIQAIIAETQPEILFVAYGSPAQELWISKHLPELKSVKIAMGVGGAFDFLSGHKKRAPNWMHKIGLEWLYRLIQEPSRIKRIWNAVIRFPLHVLRS